MPGLLKLAVYISIGLIFMMLLRKKRPKPSQFEMGLSKHRSKTRGKNLIGGLRKVKAEVIDEGFHSRDDLVYLEGKPYNIWEVLGVPSGASQAEIKKAYAQRANSPGAHKALLHKAYQKALSS